MQTCIVIYERENDIKVELRPTETPDSSQPHAWGLGENDEVRVVIDVTELADLVRSGVLGLEPITIYLDEQAHQIDLSEITDEELENQIEEAEELAEEAGVGFEEEVLDDGVIEVDEIQKLEGADSIS